MSIYYFDTSAVVKRYVIETGTAWIRQLCIARDPETSARLHEVFVGEITRVEVAAALARKAKKTKEISERDEEDAYKLFLSHLEDEYRVVLLTSASIRSAAALAQKHALRTYDAVQLALALQANNLLEADDLSLILVSGDSALLQAAQAEGLMTEDPLQHESEQGRS